MSMYFIGIDISKYKHDCCIISAVDQQIVSKFTITNDKDGFEQLLLHSGQYKTHRLQSGTDSSTYISLD